MTNVKKHIKTLVRKYGTLDAVELCEILEIEIIYSDLPKHIKGFFLNIMEQEFIYINSNLSKLEQKVVLCHELGHSIMHADLNYIYMSSSTLMSTSKYEREADFFASCLLLDDNVFNNEFNENDTLQQISTDTGVPLDLVELRWKYRDI